MNVPRGTRVHRRESPETIDLVHPGSVVRRPQGPDSSQRTLERCRIFRAGVLDKIKG